MPLECALRYSDGIVGSNTKANRQDTSVVIEFRHEVYLPVDAQTGVASGARVHRALEVVKEIDTASPVLYQHLVTNQLIQEVTVEWYKVDSALGVENIYYKHVLGNARVSSIEQFLPNTKDPDMAPQTHLERVKFVYESIAWSHVEGSLESTDSWTGAS